MNYKIGSILFLIFIVISISSLNGQVTISEDQENASSNPSALLDLQSTDKGLLIPRISEVARDSIASPADGLLVFVTTTNSFWYFNNTEWIEVRTKKRSIILTPSSMSNARSTNVSRNVIAGNQTFDFPDNIISELIFNLPVPEDFNTDFTVKLLYTSTTTTGNFRVIFFGRTHQNESNLSITPGGGDASIPSPTTAGHLAEFNLVTGNGISNLSSDFEFIDFGLRRQTQNSQDTSTGILRVIGFVFEYEAL